MTLIWITLAFLAGVVFWHKTGGWLLRRFGLRDGMRADLIKNLSTDMLVALRRDASKELERRIKITEAA